MTSNSRAFKRWFGNSKVVDKMGQPLVVYHGTPNSFTEFVSGSYTERSGFYFTCSSAFASDFAERAADGIAYEASEQSQGPSVIPCYLAIKNPLNVSKGWPESIADKLDDIVVPEWLTSWPASDFWNALDGPEGASIMDRLLRLGYDGLLASEVGNPVWVVFHPTQIKSAIGNSGAFDPTNPDICDSHPNPEPGLVRRAPVDEGFAP